MRSIIVFLALLGSLHVAAMIVIEVGRARAAHEATLRLEVEVADLEREASRLRAVIEHGNNDAYREQLARRQGFMMPHETRIVIITIP